MDQQRYYAHPQNHFWRILGELTGAVPNLPYEERLQRLISAGIALWDVCASAQRKGSLDSAIEAPQPNDFQAFFAAHPKIERVCFNGKAAEKLFDQLGQSTPATVVRVSLPSTSPANASWSYEKKLTAWRTGLALED